MPRSIHARNLREDRVGYAEAIFVDANGRTWIEGLLSTTQTDRDQIAVRRHPSRGNLEAFVPHGTKARRIHAIFYETMVRVVMVLPGGHRVHGTVPPAWVR